MRLTVVRSYVFGFAVGAALLVLVAHPAIEALHVWRLGEGGTRSGVFELVGEAMSRTFRSDMVGMMVWMGLIGGLLGIGLIALERHRRGPRFPRKPTDWAETDLASLVAQGEGEQLEFKSSLRWDWKLDRPNKALESVIAKALCGLMNHQGGILLIGVSDDGAPVGIESDFQTLSHPDWDGFERCLSAVVLSRLGARHCVRIHCQRVSLNGKSIAVIEVEPADQPVYCRDGNTDRYFVRTGNSTRELNVREAVAHMEAKRRAA